MVNSVKTSKNYRPYSVLEIKNLFATYLLETRLSNYLIQHSTCNHKYRARRNSAKDMYAISGLEMTQETCSVCYMLDHCDTNPILSSVTPEENPKTIYDLTEVKEFYTWLYKHI